MKFMLQHSIFIVYISCRGTRGHVPAGSVEGPLFSQVLGGSVALELLGVFSELALTREGRAVRSRRLLLNSSHPRTTRWCRRRSMLFPPVLRGGLWEEDPSQTCCLILRLSGSVPLSQSPSSFVRLLPTGGMLALPWALRGPCAWHRV